MANVKVFERKQTDERAKNGPTTVCPQSIDAGAQKALCLKKKMADNQHFLFFPDLLCSILKINRLSEPP